MADVVSIALSVAATLTVQGVYFVLLKYPQQLSQEKLALETRQQETLGANADQDIALELLGDAIDEMGKLSDGLRSGVAPNEAMGMQLQLQVKLAQLRGLEIVAQPLASNVGKTIAAVSRGTELAGGWQGAPNQQGAAELELLVQTLLYSAQAVQRANDRRLTAFWMQMRERQVALRSLFQTFVASAIALEVLSILFLGLGCQLLTAHHLVPKWAAWVVWVASGFGVHQVIGRVLGGVLPVLALAKSLEEKSAEGLKLYGPKPPNAGPKPPNAEMPKQETQSA